MFKSHSRWMVIALLLAVTWAGEQWAWSASHDHRTGPKRVLIIRHAEKPDTAGDPNLSPRGYERADALAKVIPAHFPRPDVLIATQPSKASNRPIETITPLSKALHEPIESDFKDDEFNKLANELLTDPRYAGKTVLIAWHHGKIPALAAALGATDAPAAWDAKVFDRVWEIKFEEDGKTKFKSLPQRALAGDSAE